MRVFSMCSIILISAIQTKTNRNNTWKDKFIKIKISPIPRQGSTKAKRNLKETIRVGWIHRCKFPQLVLMKLVLRILIQEHCWNQSIYRQLTNNRLCRISIFSTKNTLITCKSSENAVQKIEVKLRKLHSKACQQNNTILILPLR